MRLLHQLLWPLYKNNNNNHNHNKNNNKSNNNNNNNNNNYKSWKQRWSGPHTLARRVGPVMASSPLNVNKISILKEFWAFILKVRGRPK